ncbi:hypothetical protein N0V88_004774 [Collariella sp. IMI 366227]|nr:hypothetical protein N0V88_004774 [Collariella sp. IMI 366227]
MGSVGEDKKKQPFTVLITGFAPFKRDYPINPSWEIVRGLPEWLPPLRAKTTAAAAAAASDQEDSTTTPVRILIHPSPIKVSYTTVRSLIPSLWNLDGTHHPKTLPSAPGN